MNDGREVMVEIATLHILRGTVPQRELAEIMAWASAHQDLLLTKWMELNP